METEEIRLRIIAKGCPVPPKIQKEPIENGNDEKKKKNERMKRRPV